MATVMDIASKQISPPPPMPPPQTSQPKVAVKRDAAKADAVADLGLQNAKQDLPQKEDVKDVAAMAEDIKTVVEFLNTDVTFSINREIHPNLVIAKVIEKETGDVIRQIPSEEIVELAKRLDEFIGIVFNKKT